MEEKLEYARRFLPLWLTLLLCSLSGTRLTADQDPQGRDYESIKKLPGWAGNWTLDEESFGRVREASDSPDPRNPNVPKLVQRYWDYRMLNKVQNKGTDGKGANVMTRSIATVLVTTGLLCAAHSARAHHSFAMFDRSKSLSVTGTVRTLEWTNPHVWLWLDVLGADGASSLYSFEGSAPGEMARTGGWTKRSVNKGDKITVEFAPMRDGRPGGSLGRVTMANGKVVGRLSSADPGGSGGPGGPPQP